VRIRRRTRSKTRRRISRRIRRRKRREWRKRKRRRGRIRASRSEKKQYRAYCFYVVSTSAAFRKPPLHKKFFLMAWL
jgi:hypothetical protein